MKRQHETEFNGVTVCVEIHEEEYPQDILEEWGTWTDREAEFTVDTLRGFVLGEELDEPDEPWEDDFEDPDEYDEAYALWDAAMIIWEDCSFECLYETGCDYERGRYRYWAPEMGLLEEWVSLSDIEDPEERKQEKLRLGEAAGKLYARIKDYGSGWSYVSITISLEKDGEELSSSSLSGIESDMGLDYFTEIVSSVLFDAVAESGEFAIVSSDKLDTVATEIAEEVFYG